MAKSKKDEIKKEDVKTEETCTEHADNKAEQELAEKNDQLLRLAAEYDNFRKRSQREKEGIYADVKAAVLGDMLPVIDNFERAVQNSDAGMDDYKKGIDMIFSQFLEIMKKHGVESFGEKGNAFDPNLHNAVMHVDDEALGENEIAEVFSKGYKVGDKIIRPAAVKVAN